MQKREEAHRQKAEEAARKASEAAKKKEEAAKKKAAAEAAKKGFHSMNEMHSSQAVFRVRMRAPHIT
jgi:membrane protein involved in colicin uptake